MPNPKYNSIPNAQCLIPNSQCLPDTDKPIGMNEAAFGSLFKCLIPNSQFFTTFGKKSRCMFDGGAFPKSLDEELFNAWLEKGRTSNLGYKFLLIIWDEYESNFRAEYAESREDISEYDRYPSSVGRESLVAAYDLYSESRII